MAIRKKNTEKLSETASLIDGAIATEIAQKESPKATKDTHKLNVLDGLKTQSLERVAALFDALKKETMEFEEFKRITAEELERQKEQTERLEAEKQFDLLMSQRKKQAEFDEKLDREKKVFEQERVKKEEELKSQKELFTAKEKEFEQLKSEANLLPQKIEKLVDEARRETLIGAKKEFETEKKLLTQKYESDLKLLNQQIAMLQNLNKHYEKENALIKEEKTRAMEQFKELAVAAVRGKNDEIKSSQNQ